MMGTYLFYVWTIFRQEKFEITSHGKPYIYILFILHKKQGEKVKFVGNIINAKSHTGIINNQQEALGDKACAPLF